MKVFLGGTCNNSTWRDELIPMLTIDYFNPVVDDWTEDSMEEEREQRELCDFCLYTITPEMTGVYSIAEVVDDSNKKPRETIFCLLGNADNGWTEGKYRSLNQVGEMVKRNGGKYFKSLEEIAKYLETENERIDSMINGMKFKKGDNVKIINKKIREYGEMAIITNAYIEMNRECYIIDFKSTSSLMLVWKDDIERIH
ncbi:nucleoside 2-deoxyribosyltransferase domain-containing protein [Peptostreptococcus faecalis]|uniref:nucleoside 2-deoxyribosyltransferase domain-containing protein n=1 Tax=Peptostreptococcus faecalis TaxID=2045015 RepID=UPI001A9A65E3|nr:nucleoside 2-deoxyribosyltransferase domain-containing protein [Peptostreptococcus faecalis]